MSGINTISHMACKYLSEEQKQGKWVGKAGLYVTTDKVTERTKKKTGRGGLFENVNNNNGG